MSIQIKNFLALSRLVVKSIHLPVFLAAICWLGIQSSAHAQTTSTLHSFTGDPSDGISPAASLVQGTDGNLYGTTEFGGTNGHLNQTSGTAFAISPSGGSISILHNFIGYSSGTGGAPATDGGTPAGALVQGTDGNFYGTTQYGGELNNFGTVFKMTSSGTTTILHLFGDTTAGGKATYYDGTATADGDQPLGGLILGSDGNFYGTTSGALAGGLHGTIFKIFPSGTTTILHRFGDGTVTNDGDTPAAGLIQVGSTFYGTTSHGGSVSAGGGQGTVFAMTIASGVPTVTILHSFGDGSVTNDGSDPEASLVLGSDGNLYGTTLGGGSANLGTVFKVTTAGVLTILHSFTGNSVSGHPDGANPRAGLIQAVDGNFYGITTEGGTGSAAGGSTAGTVFQMTPSGTVAIIHNFNDGSVTNDGIHPLGGLIQGSDGILYGTTSQSGASVDGTIFKVALSLTYPIWTVQEGLSGTDALPTTVIAHDGLNNLYKYALGLDPRTNYNPGAPGLPFVQVQDFSGTNYLTLTFHGVATDVLYQVQASSDLLGAWTTIQSYSGTAPGTVTVQDTQDVTVSPKRFMRLLMTYPIP